MKQPSGCPARSPGAERRRVGTRRREPQPHHPSIATRSTASHLADALEGSASVEGLATGFVERGGGRSRRSGLRSRPERSRDSNSVAFRPRKPQQESPRWVTSPQEVRALRYPRTQRSCRSAHECSKASRLLSTRARTRGRSRGFGFKSLSPRAMLSRRPIPFCGGVDAVVFWRH